MRRVVLLLLFVLLGLLTWFLVDDREREEAIVPTHEAEVITRDAPSPTSIAAPEIERPREQAVEPVPATVAHEPPSSNGCRLEVTALPGGDRSWTGEPSLEIVDELGREVERSRIDANHWRVASAAPGRYRMRSLAQGFETHARAFEITDDEREKTIEFTMEPLRSLRVRWQTDDGAPFVEAFERDAASKLKLVSLRIWELSDAGERRTSHGTSGPPTAMKRWPDAPPDAVAVVEVASGASSEVEALVLGNVVAQERVPKDATEVVLRSRVDTVRALEARARLCVVDAATGMPLPEATCRTSQRNVHGAKQKLGPDGCAELGDLAAGAWTLWVEAPGKATTVLRIELEQGARLDLGSVALQPSVRVVVRATEVSGAPVPKIEFALLPEDGLGSPFDKRWTSADGRIEIDHAPRARLSLVCLDRGWAAAAHAIDLREAPLGTEEIAVEVTLAKGVEVALERALETPPTLLVVRTTDGVIVSRTYTSPLGITPLRLLPGDYIAQIGDEANVIHVGNESSVIEWR